MLSVAMSASPSRSSLLEDEVREPVHDHGEAEAREDLVEEDVPHGPAHQLGVALDGVLVRAEAGRAGHAEALGELAVEVEPPAQVHLGLGQRGHLPVDDGGGPEVVPDDVADAAVAPADARPRRPRRAGGRRATARSTRSRGPSRPWWPSRGSPGSRTSAARGPAGPGRSCSSHSRPVARQSVRCTAASASMPLHHMRSCCSGVASMTQPSMVYGMLSEGTRPSTWSMEKKGTPKYCGSSSYHPSGGAGPPSRRRPARAWPGTGWRTRRRGRAGAWSAPPGRPGASPRRRRRGCGTGSSRWRTRWSRAPGRRRPRARCRRPTWSPASG